LSRHKCIRCTDGISRRARFFDETCYRINKSGNALKELKKLGLTIQFDVMIFDLDFKDDCVGFPDIDKWWNDKVLRQVTDALQLTISPFVCHWYRTRGGGRLVFPLAEPITDPDEYEWSHACFSQQLRDIRLVSDPACKDWTRFYRLPRVLRDDVPQRYPQGTIDKGGPMSWRPTAQPPAKASETPKAEQGTWNQVDRVRWNQTKGFEFESTVPEGRRHSYLLSYAGHLRSIGHEEDQIRGALLSENRRVCSPPEDEDTVARLARDVAWRYPAGRKPDNEPSQSAEGGNDNGGDDDGDGDGDDHKEDFNLGRFKPYEPYLTSNHEVELAEHLLGYWDARSEAEVIHAEGGFWQYQDDLGYFDEVPHAWLYRLLHTWESALIHTFNKKGDPIVQRLRLSNRLTTDILKTGSKMRDTHRFFDDEGRDAFLAFADCCLQLGPDGQLWRLEHSPEYRLRFALPFEHDPEQGCPRFLEHLQWCWDGCDDRDHRIRFFQQFLGAALFQIAPRYEKAVLFIGKGANGKSTIVRIIKQLFPRNRMTAILPHQLETQRSDGSYQRASLSRSLFNVVNELPEQDLIDTSPLRSAIDGSEMRGRFPYGKPFDFCPRAAWLCLANVLPDVRDSSEATWRRMALLDFPNKVEQGEKNPTLSEDIAERELAGIAAWAVAGARDLIENKGYTMPASSDEAVREWQVAADPILSWIDERCVPGDAKARVGDPVDRLFEDFSRWCDKARHAVTSKSKFSRRVQSAGYETFRSGKHRTRKLAITLKI